MRLTMLLSCALLALHLPAFADPADLDILLQDVQELQAPGAIPGPVVAFGEQSFAIVPGKYQSARAPMIAGTRFGEGRAIIVGHGGLVDGVDKAPDNAAMVRNEIRWLSGGKHGARVGLHGSQKIAPVLEADGFQVRELGDRDVVGALGELDVLVTSGHAWTKASDGPTIAAMQGFVKRGGGLLVSACAWGWQQLNPGHDILTEFAGNRIALPLGLAFTDQMVRNTGKQGWVVDRQNLDRLQAPQALAMLDTKPDKAAMAEIGGTLTLAARSLPEDEPTLMAQLVKLADSVGEAAVPGPKHPIPESDGMARLAITIETQRLQRMPAEQVQAHPSASFYPGAVPADAPRVTRDVSVDLSVPAWHSTGLYAAPGEVITITVPDTAAKNKVAVRIGCHTDQLWHLDKWKRMPQISFETALTTGENKVANAFGGLVYLTVPNGKSGTFNASIAGAVPAPLFVLGQTDPQAWRDTIRKLPGPWAELACDKVIIAVPSANIRDLDDPVALMEFWTKVLDADADLAQIPHERKRPERYVPDEQISAGYMHSGYPIMTWMDAAPRFVNLEQLMAKGDWGMFHEMGHNHQQGTWTFGGTTEVTCNLFSVYVLEKVCGLTGPEAKRVYDDKVTKRMTDYFAAGSPFDKWKGDPFLALRMYMDLRMEFGWEPFQAVFKQYREAPKDQLPKNDDEKRDQWMVRMSRQVGRNLGPYFQQWGVPTSDAARKSIEGLPGWMPEDYPKG